MHGLQARVEKPAIVVYGGCGSISSCSSNGSSKLNNSNNTYSNNACNNKQNINNGMRLNKITKGRGWFPLTF